MSAEFALWAACHRIYNQMPTLVSDERIQDGGGQVRFMMTFQGSDGESLESLYDEERILATGFEDEDANVHLMAVEDQFMGAPCVLLVRTAVSHVDSTAVAEVTVLLNAHSEARCEAVAKIRETSRHEFKNYLEEREREAARETSEESTTAQGRSLLERWFGKQ